MTIRKLNGPLGGDYQTDGAGNAVLLNSYPLTADDDVPTRLADIASNFMFFDSFSRADQGIDGSISESGHIWHEFHPSKEGEISSGRLLFTHDSNNPTGDYPGVTLLAAPRRFGGVISFDGATGLNAACTFICGNDGNGFEPSVGHPLNMLHIGALPGFIGVNVYVDGVASDYLSFDAWTLDLTGEGNAVLFTIDGDTLTINGPGGYEKEITDSRISTVVGPIVIFEPFYYDYPTQDYIPRFDSVFAAKP